MADPGTGRLRASARLTHCWLSTNCVRVISDGEEEAHGDEEGDFGGFEVVCQGVFAGEPTEKHF